MQSEGARKLDKIELHSLVLFNVSDHIVRGSESKFGVLLGVDHGSHITLHTSFETLLVASRIDQEYLERRLGQFKTVSPAYQILGIYQINNSTSLNSLTISMVEQVKQSLNIDGTFVCMVFDWSELSSDNSTAAFETYDPRDLTPIKTVVRTNESEFIASSTASNHQEYSGKTTTSEGPSRLEHKENLAMTVNQLNDKVSKILQYLSSAPEIETGMSAAQKQKIDRLIVQLSNKLNTIKNTKADAPEHAQLSLVSTHLSLLTEQLTILDNLKAQNHKNVVWFGLTKEGGGI